MSGDYRDSTLRQAKEAGWPRVALAGRPSETVEGEENWRKLVENGSDVDVRAAREGLANRMAGGRAS
jgi:hypothetical protein